MRAFQIRDDWSIDNIVQVELAEPRPGPGEVLLRMKAASLNYRDLVVARRGYGAKTGTLPLIPISDGVGQVVEVGDGVRAVAPGDRVCPLFMQRWRSGPPTAERLGAALGGPIDGVMADSMVLGEHGVARVAEHLSDVQAATLPCAALTAWSAIVTEGRVQPGERVLVQGTGGVSLFALQFAKLAGARVFVTSSSDGKLRRALDLGADEGINYRTEPEWGRRAKALSGGDGVDHVVEVGGAGTLPQSLRAVRAGGTISVIGVLSGAALQAQLGLIVTRHVRLQGITVGSRDGFEAMNRAIAEHRLQPVVDRVFEFEQLRAALDYLASGAHFGKICIRHQR